MTTNLENKLDDKVTVVIPFFNEEKNVRKVIIAVNNSLAGKCAFDLVLVDDGSTDNTLLEMEKISTIEKNVSYISFSRNFGHQNALRAGLDFAKGDAVITMDGDLQHPPELLPEMIEKWKDGYDVVFTIRKKQKSLSWFKQRTSDMFYRLINTMSGIGIHAGAADFRLLDRKVVEILTGLTEGAIFYRGIISWVGFKQYSISYKPNKRVHGVTKYSLRKMLRLATDGITSFSFLPLRLAALTGAAIAMLSFSYVCYAIYVKLFTNQRPTRARDRVNF